MDYFNYRENQLFAEDVAVLDIAKKVGTPFYLYSKATFIRHYQVMDKSLALPKKIICFAMKSNGNLAVLKLLGEEGAGVDVVSQGEIFKALKAGIAADKIVFSGVGKTKEEISYGIEKGIFQFNAESLEEIESINEVAFSKDHQAKIAIRINPDVGAGGNDKISTGKKGDKFGIDIDLAENAIKQANLLSNIDFQGISVHIGSQITNLDAFAKAFRRVFQFVTELEKKGITINTIDLGGGLGVPYDDDTIVPPSKYGELITDMVKEFHFEHKKFIFEPGRVISANAGILISTVTLVKKTEEKEFVIADVAMNDLMRPALYEAIHQFIPVVKTGDTNKKYDFVGPVCETTDVFIKGLKFQELKSGDLFAIRSCGAYGAVMSCEYNGRPLIPEVLVDGDEFKVVRRRPSYEEMLHLEENL